MSWFTVNGIQVARAVALGSPAGSRRDIGRQDEAASGKTVVTRQTRKTDLKVSTVPCSRADAFAWECLFVGEGNVWSFDSHMYSSKGKGPVLGSESISTVQATHKKYGAKALQVTAGETWNSVDLGLGADGGHWTVAVWASEEDTPDAFRHYVLRSDGPVWTDGELGDPDGIVASGNIEVGAGAVQLNCDIAPPRRLFFDDLVAVPYLWPKAWPLQVFLAGAPFGPTPFLTCAGDMVVEASTRTMAYKNGSLSERFLVGNRGNGMERDLRTLDLELIGV